MTLPALEAPLPSSYSSSFGTQPQIATPQRIPDIDIVTPTNDTHKPPASTSRLSFSDTDRSETESVIPKHPLKRGRPRLERRSTGSWGSSCSSTSPSAGRPSRRVPQNEVERRYRESLNRELERLRCNIPSLPQGPESDITGASKPSKAVDLTGAVDYIKKVEQERDTALKRIEILEGENLNKLGSLFKPILFSG